MCMGSRYNYTRNKGPQDSEGGREGGREDRARRLAVRSMNGKELPAIIGLLGTARLSCWIAICPCIGSQQSILQALSPHSTPWDPDDLSIIISEIICASLD